MAYGLAKIPALDFRPSISLGVKIPFAAPNVFTPVYTSQEQTKYNLINFLLTDAGERPMNPNFGASLRKSLFDQITNLSLDELKLSLTNKIQSYFPNIQVTELSFLGDPDHNSVIITLSYFLLGTNQNDTATINIQNA
jgi:phage baseplate assembly protein W